MNYHALLAHFPKITYNRFKKIISYFSNLEELWNAEITQLKQAGIEESIADEFIGWKNNLSIDKILATLEMEKITTVSIGQPEYPELLAQINDPPHTLFIRGTLPKPELPLLSIVGTRHHTSYGKQVAEELAYELARQNIVLVSGLALGIDGLVHEATLRAGGITVAVLGSSITRPEIYPAFHKNLAERIIDNGGAVISEYPPGFAPTKYSFPARNRIIAGLAAGTLVIEAPVESGSLITAKAALDYNREVLAVPHPIFSTQGAGTNELIKSGATLVSCANDVIEALHLKNIQTIIENRQTLPASTPLEATILATLSKEPKHVDVIIKETKLESQIVNSNLVLMEMKGRVKNLGGMMYVIKF
jgi:DNA processing protein